VLEGLGQKAHSKLFLKAPPSRTQVIGETWEIPRCEMHAYLDQNFYEMYQEWLRYRRYGFRYNGGWAEQPAPYVDILDIFESEFQRWKKGDS
jgi:hypothetical protein